MLTESHEDESCLDPAGPDYYNADATERFDVTDAYFVDVIHTNAACTRLEDSHAPVTHFSRTKTLKVNPCHGLCKRRSSDKVTGNFGIGYQIQIARRKIRKG
ncbi:hypothetical protein TNCV_1753051 [Trichonephila clavipes]|nr:hypothetical protein TNCV_1753051 [Trichonephila clavipes]